MPVPFFRRALLLAPVLLAALPGTARAADYPLQIIQLQGRPSAELVPLIEVPLGAGGERVSCGMLAGAFVCSNFIGLRVALARVLPGGGTGRVR